MFTEEQLLPISALQHMIFCPRQCALIHLEQSWAENRFTAEGQLLHTKVDTEGYEKRQNLIQSRAMTLCSYRYGLIGKADLVEFRKTEEGGIELKNRLGKWRIKPVEYKRGKPKKNNSDKVQLCAQALCLEEQFMSTIHKGEIFYGKEKHRLEVEINEALREETLQTIEDFHMMIKHGQTPQAVYESKKCQSCSLEEICLPQISQKIKVNTYFKSCIKTSLEDL